MLLFKGPRDQFLEPLQAVAGIVEKRHTLAILSNVLIEKNDSVLTLLATDIEMQIRARTEAAMGETAAVTVAARKLQDILQSLPESAEITLKLDDKRLLLMAGKSRFALQTLPAEDFPKISETQETLARLRLSAARLRHLIGRVQYAMASQDIRYYLNGMLLAVQDNELRCVATDGHRLAYIAEPLGDNEIERFEQDAQRIEAILPRKTVLELFRQLSDEDDELEITLSPTQAKFTFANIEFISKLIDGKFPDYERVIPQQHNRVVVLERNLFLHALQRAAILTSEKFRGVRLMLAPGSLKISATNTENEEALEELEVEYAADAMEIGFNVKYLLDVLANVSAERIEMRLLDANSSALIVMPDERQFKYVVMPMRI
ncbi:MAG: DNA polymerase III subunit beta [Rhodocyclaceae bacterium]|nr:DNA polymerase III subunit beta [Rhodocyclaceae bacterium]